MQILATNIVRQIQRAVKAPAFKSLQNIADIGTPFRSCTLNGEVGDILRLSEQGKVATKFSSFVENFLFGKDKEIEKTLKIFDFAMFGKEGLPLSYPRKKFISDVQKALKDFPDKESAILSRFNLSKGIDDFDGIANPYVKGHSAPVRKISEIIENFYKNNSTTIKDPAAKKAMDTIIGGLSEFNMAIGKVQHGTHAYSVDIHSFSVLQKSMNNPAYESLSEESKAVLKLTALMHDFGKKANIITTGHAAISKKEAEWILRNYNLPQKLKTRVIHQIEHHHWFEQYNKGIYSPLKVATIFGDPEDLKVAKILAKSDLESISPDFHLMILDRERFLTQREFDRSFTEKIGKIEPLEKVAKKYDDFEQSMLKQREAIADMKSGMAEPENGFSLLEGIKEGYFTPNFDIRKIINNSRGKLSDFTKESNNYKFIRFLDEALTKSSIPRDTTLYRGGSPFDFGLYNMEAPEFLQKFYKDGRLFTIPIYTHTSRSPMIAQQFMKNGTNMVFRMNVPKGTKAVYMEGLGCRFQRNEKEVLLPRNLTYKFVKRTELPTCNVLEVDVLPEVPANKKVHRFWEEAGEEYWNTTVKIPDLG